MASTYSNLKIQLMATGENSGTWGNVTNVNLGTAIEEAIAGSADVTFSSGNVTLTLTDTNASQTARNMRLNLTGTTGGARDLIVPAIEKMYVVNNGCADAVTVKVSGQTGVAVPAGKSMVLFNNGTDVVNAITHLASLTLASALPVSSGGTGATTLTGVVKGNGTSAFTAGSVNLASEVTGTLPVANGGTGQTSYTNGQLLIGNSTGNTLTKATLTAGSGISITNGAGSITISGGISDGDKGDITVSSSGATWTIDNSVVTNAKLSLSANASNIKVALNANNNPPIYACRAWVNFNGQGTPSIRGSGNVSSITDYGTGLFGVNFSTSMPDTNYCTVADSSFDLNANTANGAGSGGISASTATNYCRVGTGNTAGPYDQPYVYCAIFR